MDIIFRLLRFLNWNKKKLILTVLFKFKILTSKLLTAFKNLKKSSIPILKLLKYSLKFIHCILLTTTVIISYSLYPHTFVMAIIIETLHFYAGLEITLIMIVLYVDFPFKNRKIFSSQFQCSKFTFIQCG